MTFRMRSATVAWLGISCMKVERTLSLGELLMSLCLDCSKVVSFYGLI